MTNSTTVGRVWPRATTSNNSRSKTEESTICQRLINEEKKCTSFISFPLLAPFRFSRLTNPASIICSVDSFCAILHILDPTNKTDQRNPQQDKNQLHSGTKGLERKKTFSPVSKVIRSGPIGCGYAYVDSTLSRLTRNGERSTTWSNREQQQPPSPQQRISHGLVDVLHCCYGCLSRHLMDKQRRKIHRGYTFLQSTSLSFGELLCFVFFCCCFMSSHRPVKWGSEMHKQIEIAEPWGTNSRLFGRSQ